MIRTSIRLAVLLVLGIPAPARSGSSSSVEPGAGTPDSSSVALVRLENRYSLLLARHRPDLAERYGSNAIGLPFVALDEANVDAHLRELRRLLSEAEPLPASTRTDSLRARLRREIAETARGGTLRRDALLWLDIVDAAARAPFAVGSAGGCDRARRAALQLRTLPEALRGATVLMRGAPAPEPVSFEARLARLELLLRADLPARIDACKESRRRAEFVVADTLAAASLAQFRRWLLPGK